MTKTTMTARELAKYLAELISVADYATAPATFDPDAPLHLESVAGLDGVQGFEIVEGKLTLVDTLEPMESATEDFAKLYRFGFGQVLVERIETEDDESPAVSFSCIPPGLGVCSSSVVFDSDEKADLCFQSMTAQSALDGISVLLKMLDKAAEMAEEA